MELGKYQTRCRWYLCEVLIPDVNEFSQNHASERHAYHALAACFHLSDWVLADHGGEESVWCLPNTDAGMKGFRDKLIESCADFSLVRDCANASKHLELTRGNPATPTATAIDSSPTGLGQGRFGEGPLGGTKSVIVRVNENDIRHVSAVVNNVRDMWVDLFSKRGW